MAEETFSSRADSHKRKFDEPPPAPRRPTGFSAAPPPEQQTGSYNSVPPPMDEIALAKQRAQEIVARLVNSADAKRPRTDDPSETLTPSNGFLTDLSQNPPSQPMGNLQVNPTVAAQPASYYGFQGTSKKIDIPNGKVGVIIGKGGETIKYLQLQSGAKIQVTRDSDADPNSPNRQVELVGTSEQISRAEQLIKDVIAEAEAGGSGALAARGISSVQPDGSEQFVMKVPNNKVGLIIGKGGETIKTMQSRTGARIQVIPLHLPPGDTSTERTVQMNGTKEQIEAAKELVNEIVNETRPRNPTMSTNYLQPGAYRPPRPPYNWGPPGPPPMQQQQQQPGYGYTQPGPYSGPPPYMSQPYAASQQYAAYPQQPPAAYNSSWDQTTPASNPTQAPQQAPGYDYYTQPGQTTAPTAPDTNYGYTQQPPTSSAPYEQSYSQPSSYTQQDGYNTNQAPNQPASQAPYDQTQAYSGPNYGPPGAPTQQESAPSYGTQGSSQAQPVQPVGSQPGYGVQPPPAQGGFPSSQPMAQSAYGQPGPYAQAGYGPQAQKPPAYGPVAGVAQPGYPTPSPPAQSGYGPPAPYTSPAPPDQAHQGGSSYGQAGYGGQPAYGQPGYSGPQGYAGGVGEGYGGYEQRPSSDRQPASGHGYSQQPPPAYGAETGSGASSTPVGVPKTSPQS
ncbi:far upstream element-binding protein 2 [Amborella trichopoda]|uniref:K Homology domain-containing protein n=1 Tax=Amborella trichopoda TaxID=13333 RepID=W1PSA7_AMBTC|nr:far upstream element-binding protein 2 [Amborella trichopoda]ERN10135.1 hypothetical protein AMTR_s00169p00047130 [Amborella trichopoda]|eukprot:XP_006848554.1 far upstream element-binding protein 2 [Amborella trichopoda]